MRSLRGHSYRVPLPLSWGVSQPSGEPNERLEKDREGPRPVGADLFGRFGRYWRTTSFEQSLRVFRDSLARTGYGSTMARVASSTRRRLCRHERYGRYPAGWLTNAEAA